MRFSQCYYSMQLVLCSCCFRIDAARDDDSLGRLVNDDHKNPNSKMRTITVDRKPHLCSFTNRCFILFKHCSFFCYRYLLYILEYEAVLIFFLHENTTKRTDKNTVKVPDR